VDKVNAIMQQVIFDESQNQDEKKGDHFAKPGSNTRIWNFHQKLAEQCPETYVKYNENEILPLVCESWLGPGYQVTSQVNIVHPGVTGQKIHCDYHLGLVEKAVIE